MNRRKYIGIELKKEYFDEATKNVNDVKAVMNPKKKQRKVYETIKEQIQRTT